MTEPQAPPPVPLNRAAVGGLVFIVFNVVFIAAGAMVPSPLAGLIRLLLLGNVVIPVIALVKGWGRFAAGWAIGVGVAVIVFLGFCMAALSHMG